MLGQRFKFLIVTVQVNLLENTQFIQKFVFVNHTTCKHQSKFIQLKHKQLNNKKKVIHDTTVPSVGCTYRKD